MPLKEFQENLKTLSTLIDQLPNFEDAYLSRLVRHYTEQNILLLNDVVATSIVHLKKIQHAKTADDIICTQARFSNEIAKKLSLSTQRFLNASLGQIADYNEWLKAHCDLATD